MAPKKETNKQDDLDFEIRFIESVLQKNPLFLEALIALGDLYTKRGFHEKGLEIDQKLLRLKPQDPIVLYNLACSYSLVNEIEKSLQTIKSAIEFGYSDFRYLGQDNDLENLRRDSRFQEFLSTLKKETAKNK